MFPTHVTSGTYQGIPFDVCTETRGASPGTSSNRKTRVDAETIQRGVELAADIMEKLVIQVPTEFMPKKVTIEWPYIQEEEFVDPIVVVEFEDLKIEAPCGLYRGLLLPDRRKFKDFSEDELLVYAMQAIGLAIETKIKKWQGLLAEYNPNR